MIVRSHLFWNLFICYLLRSYIYAKNKRGVLTVPAFIKLYLDYFFTYKKMKLLFWWVFFISFALFNRELEMLNLHTQRKLYRVFVVSCDFVKLKKKLLTTSFIFQQVFFRNLASNINISLMKRTKMLQERIPVYAIVKDTTWLKWLIYSIPVVINLVILKSTCLYM